MWKACYQEEGNITREQVEALLNTYNRPEVLRNTLVKQLEDFPHAGNTPIDQRHMFCKVKAIWTQLSNLNEQPGSTPLMRTIRSKFPKKDKRKVGEMGSKNDKWTTEDLLRALESNINQLEIMEDTDPLSTRQSKSYAASGKRESPAIRERSGAQRISINSPQYSAANTEPQYFALRRSYITKRKKKAGDTITTVLEMSKLRTQKTTLQGSPVSIL
ncbi:hypothetical protein COOONC_17228 [Cooperia oncophora]